MTTIGGEDEREKTRRLQSERLGKLLGRANRDDVFTRTHFFEFFELPPNSNRNYR